MPLCVGALFSLQRTQLIVSRLSKVLPLKTRGRTLHKCLIDCCVRCSGKKGTSRCSERHFRYAFKASTYSLKAESPAGVIRQVVQGIFPLKPFSTVM